MYYDPEEWTGFEGWEDEPQPIDNEYDSLDDEPTIIMCKTCGSELQIVGWIDLFEVCPVCGGIIRSCDT